MGMTHKSISNHNQNQIKCIREKLGLGRTEFANLLGLGTQGERTVRGWETGEHKPSAKKVAQILALEDELQRAKKDAPFYSERSNPAFRFIDLFAGIGGIRIPFQNLGGKCVFTSEWDKFAQKTYLTNFGDMPNGDITQISATDIPDHDVLLGGFPCQAFSQAGLKKGFNDTRGTMFFEIQRILVEKRPKAFLLENVKQLRGHDKGRTLKTIMAILKGEHESEMPQDIPLSDEARHALSEKLNYWVDFKVLRAADFGAPQNRERVFLVGFDKDFYSESDIESMFRWPVAPKTKTRVGDILEDLTNISIADDKFTISDKLWEGHQKRKAEHLEKGNGFGYSLFNADSEYTNTISARYYKDGSEILIDQTELGKNPRKLTPRECARLQGFPENYIVDAVSQGQIYKQFGNSVCMNVISAVADSMVSFMKLVDEKRNVA
ncbi:DNA (cytosine-5-)-methyltransferase [Alteromonas pelagimontana]|uniref:Cytosine-specific methyltransferase n=1 Tax=Alteromonas pelagimontana TaxID=1858656 RepID=A0A6M4MD69_9ALTE|nr:DNA (cytosine-5-)-methyltransferase [Alteromonas pelagimontana]QJR81062.1 DNA (cytosine-5-)-methyltransferase [Alteromonas pelagimontana]